MIPSMGGSGFIVTITLSSFAREPLRGRRIRGAIKLGQFLKFAGLVEDGGQARIAVQAGDVRVNGRVETRRGHRLADGDVVVVVLPHGAARAAVPPTMVRRMARAAVTRAAERRTVIPSLGGSGFIVTITLSPFVRESLRDRRIRAPIRVRERIAANSARRTEPETIRT